MVFGLVGEAMTSIVDPDQCGLMTVLVARIRLATIHVDVLV